MHDTPDFHMPKLLMVISSWDKSQKVSNVIRSCRLQLHYQCRAEGTADSNILDMLGLGSTEKSLTLCLVPQSAAGALMDRLAGELQINKKSRGVAFLLSLSGAGISFFSKLNRETQTEVMSRLNNLEREMDDMNNEMNHDLIYAIINQGYSGELMDAARSAGAAGGTVIRARNAGVDEKNTFFGHAVQEEKEIVMILTGREQKNGLMQAISEKCGAKSEARGIIFSLPVNAVIGLEQ